MADENVDIKLNLDAKKFIEELLKAKEGIVGLGEAKNLEGLIGGLTKATAVLGVLAVAYYAVKTAAETVFEAENIKAVNHEFEILTKNAGLAGDALKKGLVEAAHGLADDTDLTKAANRAIIEMGASASKLPEIMELARKATSVFGGDLVSNFEAMNQAIASGNTRSLKQMGIIVDSSKAFDNFAKSLGITTAELSQQGKQQAIMNAVLEKGQANFKGISGDVKEAQNTWQQFKVTVGEIGEAITLAFEKIAGPSVRKSLQALRDWTGFLKDKVIGATTEFGESAEANAIHIEKQKTKVSELTIKVAEMTRAQEVAQGAYGRDSRMYMDATKDLGKYAAQLDEAKNKLHEMNEVQQKAEEAKAVQPVGQPKAALIDKDANLKVEAKFHEDLAKIQESTLQQATKNSQDIKEAEALVDQEIAAEHAALSAQKNAIDQQYGEKSDRARELKTALDEQQAEKDIQRDDRVTAAKIAALDRHASHAKGTQEAIVAGWQHEGAKAIEENNKAGNMGAIAFTSLKNNATKAFMAIGEGSKSSAEIMKEFMLGAIADMAESKGSFLLASGLGELALGNPGGAGAAAEGGALLALAGFLRSQAGGKGSSGGGASVGGGGGSAGGASTAGPTDNSKPAMEETKKKSVSVNIQGPMFGTDESNRWLMERIREASDATDFNLVKIGQT